MRFNTKAVPPPLMRKEQSGNLILLAGIAGFLCILVVTFFHQQPPLFDEAYFVKNFDLFEKHGLSREFLVQMDNQAPGPLYELVHFAFKPLTNLTTPGIRLVNVFLLGLTILILAKIISITRQDRFRDSLYFGVALMAVPMVWQVTGLALTEMPAMFFSALSMLILLMAIRKEPSAILSIFLALLAGLCLGLSILGRSPFLVLIPAAGVFLLDAPRSFARWRTLGIYGLCALTVCVPVFIIWDGLVPPQQAFVGKGFSAWHGILAFAYGALLTAIIAPRWFFFNRNVIWYILAGYALFLLINIYLVRYEYSPLDKVMAKFLPADFMKFYPLLISPLLAALAVYFIICCLRQAWFNRQNTVFLFFLVAGMLMFASNFKVTHLFSTRYVAQAAPFFVLLFPSYDRPGWGRLIRFIAGMIIGFLSLETYFDFA